MRLKANHILFRFLFVLLIFPEIIIAQDTLEISNYKMRFQKNLEESAGLFCQSNSGFDNAKIETLPVGNFDEALKKLDLPFFETPAGLAEDFFLFLDNLPENQKERLIRNYYFSEKYFVEAFKSASLPQELKYMAPAYSAMNRNAAGEDVRAGIWQLTHFEGILNGLTVNRLVDERLNEHLAIHSYIEELTQNKEIFGSLELAVLAQWYGKAKVQNALYFTDGNKSLDKLLEFFPETVNEKIAVFQAVAVFLSDNLIMKTGGTVAQNQIPDTVEVFHQLHFKQISEVMNIPENQLVCLNPQYRFEIVPANDIQHKIAIPKGYHDDYLAIQDSIFNALDSSLFEITVQKIEYPPTPTRQYLGEPVKDLEIEGKTKIQYRLKTGDVLGIIAEKYDVRVEDLKYWNNIINERRIQAGNNIDIFVDNDQVDYYLHIDEIESGESSASDNFVEQLRQSTTLKIPDDLKDRPKVEYVVKSGESPYTIAQKFDGVTTDDILLWNNIDDARKIQVGQKLTIYLKE